MAQPEAGLYTTFNGFNRGRGSWPAFADSASPFRSFWMGGFEGADHLNSHGVPLDMARVTGHLQRLDEDYARAAALGLSTVRVSIGWRLTETRPGRFDFARLRTMAQAARRRGLQVVWTLMHYGTPPDVSLFDDGMIERFARFAGAVAQTLAPLSPEPPVYNLVNEIGFLAWAVSETSLIHPYCNDLGRRRAEEAAGETADADATAAESTESSGYDVKRRLAQAVLAGIDAVRKVDPRARFLHVEPVVHVVAPPGRADLQPLADCVCAYQWQAWDLIGGLAEPELGGNPGALDLIGVNYYHSGQWEVKTEQRLWWHLRDPRRRPLSALLDDTWRRYRRPLVVAETSHVGAGRAAWLHEVAAEVEQARADGVPVGGICLYPLIDRPDWNDAAHWHHSGLWNVDTGVDTSAGIDVEAGVDTDIGSSADPNGDTGTETTTNAGADTRADSGTDAKHDTTGPGAPPREAALIGEPAGTRPAGARRLLHLEYAEAIVAWQRQLPYALHAAAPDERSCLIVFSHQRWNAARGRLQHLMLHLAAHFRVFVVEEPLCCESIGSGRGAAFEPRLDRIARGPGVDVLVPRVPGFAGAADVQHAAPALAASVAAPVAPASAARSASPAVSADAPASPALPAVAASSAFESAQSAQSRQWALIGSLLSEFMRRENIAEAELWFTSPRALPLLGHVPARIVVYDCNAEWDRHDHGAAAGSAWHEAALLKCADLVLTGSPSLHARFSRLHPAVHWLPDAVDAERFCPALLDHDSEEAEAVRQAQAHIDAGAPRLGYFGTVDERLDLSLIATLADRRPDCHVVIVGAVVGIDESRLPRCRNLHWLGPQPYARMPYFAAGWDVCLLPFALNTANRCLYPSQTLEYLAAERPVVGTALPDLVRGFGAFIRVASSADSFVRACSAALDEGGDPAVQFEQAVSARSMLAALSWQRSTERVRRLMEGHRAHRHHATAPLRASTTDAAFFAQPAAAARL